MRGAARARGHDIIGFHFRRRIPNSLDTHPRCPNAYLEVAQRKLFTRVLLDTHRNNAAGRGRSFRYLDPIDTILIDSRIAGFFDLESAGITVKPQPNIHDEAANPDGNGEALFGRT